MALGAANGLRKLAGLRAWPSMRRGEAELELAGSFCAPLYWVVGRLPDGSPIARNGTAFFLNAGQGVFGVTACHVEPIWCVIPRRAVEAPWAFPGSLPYRELPSGRILAAGDQVMIDTGMLHAGYMSDFGCTWVCGGRPGAQDRALRARWEEIVAAVLAECRPGATAAALHRAALAANGPGRPAPWPVPLYLAHGIGIGGVEPPFIGTDLGMAAEEAMTLVPGMVLVLEPYVWEEGAGGYRAEQMIAITAAGHERLSAPPP